MDPKLRAVLAFVAASAGAAWLEQSASRQAAKLGIPHIVIGLLVAGMAHEL